MDDALQQQIDKESHVDDGGPAFPVPMVPIDNTGGFVSVQFGGMTLRDWFAGQCMQGASASTQNEIDERGAEIIARESYRMADAMLKARSR